MGVQRVGHDWAISLLGVSDAFPRLCRQRAYYCLRRVTDSGPFSPPPWPEGRQPVQAAPSCVVVPSPREKRWILPLSDLEAADEATWWGGEVPLGSSGLLPYGLLLLFSGSYNCGAGVGGWWMWEFVACQRVPFCSFRVYDGQRCFPQFLVAVFAHPRSHFGAS